MQDGDWMNDQFLLAHERAGLRKRSGRYAWRRTYISESLMAGVNEFWLCKQSGHDIATMRRHYAEWIQENKEADLRNMAILKSKNEEQSQKRHTNGTQIDDPKN